MGRVFASSDWHGCGEIGNKILDSLQINDTLYFLGDAIDRGPDGYNLMKRLLSDPRVIYIRGNHEQMMGNAIPHILNGYYNGASTWLDMNGGEITWGCIESLPEEQIRDIISLIGSRMPTTAIYENKNGQRIILEHAGYSPYDRIPHRSHDPFWDRDHFYDEWDQNNSKEAERSFIVHGHTPVQYLEFHYGYKGQPPITKEMIDLKHKWDYCEDMGSYKPSVIRYCDGHKFDIDMCTIASHRGVLLDLDTFEEIYFDVDKYWWEKEEV